MKLHALVAIGSILIPGVSFGTAIISSDARSLEDSRRAAAAPTELLYYGGPVLSNVKTIAVFWGPNVDATVQKEIGAFYGSMTNSTYMDWLDQEYNTKRKAVDGRPGTNQDIGRGTYWGAVTIAPHNQSVKLDAKDVEAELAYQLDQGALPAPDANSLYMVHFPASISLTADGVGAACKNWCAEHDSFSSERHGSVVYAIMPDCGGCAVPGSPFDAMTDFASHELIESVTNPIGKSTAGYPNAWIAAGYEIGDLCQDSKATLKAAGRTYVIQGEWQNSTKSCKGGEFRSSESTANGAAGSRERSLGVGEMLSRWEAIQSRVSQGTY